MLRLARRSLLAALALPLLAACGDDDGDTPVAPIATFPVGAQALDSLADAIAPLRGAPVLGAFLLMDDALIEGLPFDDQDPFVPPEVRGDRAAMAPPARPAAQRSLLLIPDSLRGLTFVPQEFSDGSTPSGSWRVDTLPDGTPRRGAPANGVRFMLETREFWSDPVTVGTLDVTQGGTAAAPVLTAQLHDLAGTRVLSYAAGSSLSGSGYLAVGGARIDQVTTGGPSGTRARLTIAGTPSLEVRRERTASSRGVAYLNAVRVAGHDLQVVASEVDRGDDFAITYTVLADGAPFARLRTTMFVSGGQWEHVAGDRPLTEGEGRQVRALLRALRAVPEPEQVWTEGLFYLLMLQSPGF